MGQNIDKQKGKQMTTNTNKKTTHCKQTYKQKRPTKMINKKTQQRTTANDRQQKDKTK